MQTRKLKSYIKNTFWSQTNYSKVNQNQYTIYKSHPLQHIGQKIRKEHQIYQCDYITNYTYQKDYLEITRNCYNVDKFLDSLQYSQLIKLKSQCENKEIIVVDFLLDSVTIDKIRTSIYDAYNKQWIKGFNSYQFRVIFHWVQEQKSYVVLTTFPILDRSIICQALLYNFEMKNGFNTVNSQINLKKILQMQ